MHGNLGCMFDHWAHPAVHLLLLKISTSGRQTFDKHRISRRWPRIGSYIKSLAAYFLWKCDSIKLDTRLSKIFRIQNDVHEFSATRFGKFLPLWQKFKNIWLFLDGLFSVRQYFEPFRQNFTTIGQIFIIVNGQIWNKLSSRLITLSN